jgi:hypothetical protein
MSAAKRPTTRRGRWTYNGGEALYGIAGWHLDGTPLVIDFMPGNHQCCNGGRGCCHGCYVLYNWPARSHDPVSMYVDSAMEAIEEEWDALDDGQRLAITERRVAA